MFIAPNFCGITAREKKEQREVIFNEEIGRNWNSFAGTGTAPSEKCISHRFSLIDYGFAQRLTTCPTNLVCVILPRFENGGAQFIERRHLARLDEALDFTLQSAFLFFVHGSYLPFPYGRIWSR
jgi:hypothetical protein